MIALNDKFKIVNSLEELSSETGYNVLYITNDPDKVMIFYLMTVLYRSIGSPYYSYKHCSYLSSNVIAWVYNDKLPDGFEDGLYYKGFDQYEKYRTSFPFPYTTAKYSDGEVVFVIEEVKAAMKGYPVTITDRKSLKAKWNDVVFNMTWMKGWIEKLANVERKKIQEEKIAAADHFQNFLTDTFKNIPELGRVPDYWDKTKFKNEWVGHFKYCDIRFVPYTRKQADGTYIIQVSSPVFGSKDICKNHRKTIIKIIKLTQKYQEDLSKTLS